MSSAYLLISHGSRDPRPQQAMEKLAKLVCLQLGTGGWGVRRREGELETGGWGVRCREGELEAGGWGQGEIGYTRSLSLPNPKPQTAVPSQGLLQKTRDLSFQAKGLLQRTETKQATARAVVVSSAGYPLVGTATLELADAPLHEQIRQFACVALTKGYNHLQLLPLFLLPGMHVREDIPTEVVLAQQCLGDAMVLKLRPHIGEHPGLGRQLASQWARVDADAKILLCHGSRRAGGNEPVEAMAEWLGALAAYWSVQPMLEDQIQVLVAAGHKRIGILPYFIFPGGITDAIAQRLGSLQAKFPSVQLSLGEPIGASDQLANLIVDLIEQ